MSEFELIVIDELANEEGQILDEIHRVVARPYHLANLFGARAAKHIAEELSSVKSLEGINKAFDRFLINHATTMAIVDRSRMSDTMSRQLIGWIYDSLIEREQKKLRRKAKKSERRLANRTMYLPEVVLSREAIINSDGSIKKQRWNGLTDLKSGGLLRLAVEHRYGPQDTPVCFAVQNNIPELPELQDNGEVEMIKPEVDPQAWNGMQSEGLLISGYRLALPMYNQAGDALPGAQWAFQLFPKAIDFRAYIHSLNAPTLPGGFIANVPVKFTTITTVNAEGNEIPAETDGCGRIHPMHPLFTQLQRPGGAAGECIVQIRFINEHGTFAKGILVPDERCLSPEGKPEIWFDWMQVKGSRKEAAKKAAKANRSQYSSGYLGVIQAWDRPRTLKWSFEQLQMFERNEITESIIEEWIDEAYEEYLAGGVDAIMAKLARDNQQISMINQLACAINIHSDDAFVVTQVPMVRRAVDESLGRILYFLAQGCGKKSKQYTAVLDDGVPEGHVVLAGFKPGEEVVVHRFPTHLPQCMMKLKVTRPLPHMLVGGKVVRNAIYFNKRDLTDKAQGDSDGDVVGVTSDPRAIEMMDHIIGDGRVYLVEPEGEKFETKTDSKPGHEYILGKPRGPVGIMCIWQAQMYAVGRVDAACAMGYPYQESIDVAKRAVIPTDFISLCDQDAWQQHPDQPGRWYYDVRLTQRFPTDNDFIKYVGQWVKGTLSGEGIITQGDGRQNVIAWHSSSKRINPRNWVPCSTKGKWDGGNLVHHCHDYALEVWRDYEHLFDLDAPEVPMINILRKLFKAHDTDVQPLEMDWYQYVIGLRTKSGLTKFGNEMRRIMSRNMGDKERQAQISTTTIVLNAELAKLNLAEMECVWRMELTEVYRHRDDYDGRTEYLSKEDHPDPNPSFRANNPNHAFRAIAWEGSPVMEMLGIINADEQCNFFTNRPKAVDKTIDVVMQEQDPHRALTARIYNNKSHARHVVVNGEGIPGHACPHCTATLHNALVRRLRTERTTAEHEYIKTRLVPVLNGTTRK